MARLASILKLKARLLLKALAPRLCFIFQGLVCVDFIVWRTGQQKYFNLLVCLGLIVLEGIFNVVVRNGKEFHWVCPSAILFSIVIIGTLTVLRVRELNFLLCQRASQLSNDTCIQFLAPSMNVDPIFSFTPSVFTTWESENGLDNARQQISYIEQISMAMLILGRWSLPKGSINREQFLQIVLIYIGTAADILELSEIFDDNLTGLDEDVLQGIYYGTISVWALALAQFGITIALPEDGLKKDEEDDSEDAAKWNQFEQNATGGYFRSKFQNKVAPMSYMHYKSMLRERAKTQSDAESMSTKDQKPKALPNMSNFIMLNGLTKGDNKVGDIEQGSAHNNRIDNIDVFRPKRIHLVDENKHFNNGAPISSQNGSMRSFFSNSNIKPGLASKNGVLPNLNSSTLASSSPSSPITNSQDSLSSLKNGENVFSTPSTSEGRRNTNKNFWRDVLTKYTYTRHFANGRDIQRRSERRKQNSETEDNSTGVGTKEVQNCCVKYIGVVEMLQCVFMQDGPFFILRFVFWAHYTVTTNMTFLLLGKNLLVIVIQVYRILLLYCKEPDEKEPLDLNDASNRVQFAIESNRRLSNKNGAASRQEYLAGYVLDTL